LSAGEFPAKLVVVSIAGCCDLAPFRFREGYAKRTAAIGAGERVSSGDPTSSAGGEVAADPMAILPLRTHLGPISIRWRYVLWR